MAGALARAGVGNPLLGLAPGALPDGRPAGDLCAPGGDTAAATDLVQAIGSWLGTDERRVAASLVVLGYAARLVGPAVAVLLRDGLVVDLRPDRVRYTYRPAEGFRLGAPEPTGWRGPPEPLRAAWCEVVLDGHLGPLIDGVRRVVPVAAGLLWGNVASGLAGALRALAAHGDVPASRCHAAGRALLAHGPLRGSGELRLTGAQLSFRRRSCCLYYRLEGGGTCGDCPLPAQIGR